MSRTATKSEPLRARRSVEPSADAIHAFDQFDAARSFFRTDAQLARALGWKPNTVAAWHARNVTRPRLAHRRDVARLLQLVERAAEWTVDDHLAGDWTLVPQADLGNRSPSVVLRVLGDKGLAAMLGAFAQIAPRTLVGEVDLPSATELEAALRRTLGGDALAIFEQTGEPRQVEADLSDFEDY